MTRPKKKAMLNFIPPLSIIIIGTLILLSFGSLSNSQNTKPTARTDILDKKINNLDRLLDSARLLSKKLDSSVTRTRIRTNILRKQQKHIQKQIDTLKKE